MNKPVQNKPKKPRPSRSEFMGKLTVIAFAVTLLLFFSLAWSPRDFLTRRLAADLIARSNTFKAPQQFWMQTGVISNKDYLSPEYLTLQHHGWISANNAPCPEPLAKNPLPKNPPALLAPPPCWDVTLTPSGVETINPLVAPAEAEKSSFSIPAAHRDLIAVTGVSKQGNLADVEFIWKWTALNEFGAALYSSDTRYHSTVALRDYDDGWRVIQTAPHFNQPLDDALKNAEPAQ
jgi:hypothetical protein